TFMWRGIDGTETFTHLITTQDATQPKDSFYTTYNGKLDPVCLMRGWDRYHEKDLNNDILVCYGYGDGGGGPSRPMLETGIRMEKGITGSPKVRMEPSLQYFDELYERVGENKNLPKWVGELYLETHRGTYTSMARNKRSNRKCELLWADVELFSVMAEALGESYNTNEIYKAWETILLNQFHDIIPGSSIFEVYEVTKKEYADLESRGKEIIAQKLQKIANATSAKTNELVVFNSLSFDRDDSVIVDNPFYSDVTSFIDSANNILPVAKTADGKITFNPVCIPAKGYSIFTPSKEILSSNERIIINDDSIETPFYKITFDKSYQFTSIFDKDFSREIIKDGQKANVLRVFEDKPTYYDNWNIDIFYTQKSWICDDVTSANWIENNDVRAVLEIKRQFLDSTIIQKVIFYTNSRRIDFDTYVDWKQFNLLMKCEFPVDINANEATYDIQFGNLKRPTHKNTSWDAARFEVCGHKWADLSEGNYGVALLNDCKYGYAINDSTMTLSLIKSGCVPNPIADQEEHFFTYALLPHESNEFEEVVKEAYCLNLPTYNAQCESAEQKINYDAFFTIDAQNVIMEVTKKADDNDGIIVRLYEFQNRRSNIHVTVANKFNEVFECNMLEENEESIAENSTAFSFEI
ncbi:MAG: glycoside hydrolase family 38 C-terminal domain-containing protein, partial [Oscillospiraceae bacterium]